MAPVLIEARSAVRNLTRAGVFPVPAWLWSERWTFDDDVDPSGLRTAHSDFRDAPIQKHALMSDVLDRLVREHAPGTLPALERVAGLVRPFLPVTLLRCDQGRLYVFDGQSRVLHALWHQVRSVEAFVFDEGLRRPLP